MDKMAVAEAIDQIQVIEDEVFNCSKIKLPEYGVCMEYPEEMLKPWKTNPMFFEIIVAHAITFIFGVIGNVIVIIVMAGDSKSRTATNSFLVSLAIGDLLMLCVYGPLETYMHFVIKWDENGIVCKTAQLAELLSATSSVLNLLAVTVERFVVIVFPMKSRTLCTVSNMVKAVLGVWLLAFLLASPVIFTTGTYKILFTNNVTSITLNYCNPSVDSPIFVLYQFFIIFGIPSITMTVCYSFVIRELWASTRKMNMLTNGVSFRNKVSKTPILSMKKNPSKGKCDTEYSMVDVRLEYPVQRHFSYYNSRFIPTKNPRKSFRNSHEDCLKPNNTVGHYVTTNKDEANAARKQVIKMLILVVVLFFVCWGPRVTMDVLQKFHLVQYNQTVYTMRMIFNIMTFFHGCINPFIYSFMSKNFRSRFLRYLEKCGCRKSSDWPASRLMQNSTSQKSQPGPSTGKNEITGKCVCGVGPKKTGHGSFISCDTKSTEVDSVLHAPPGSSYPSNITICVCSHHQDAC